MNKNILAVSLMLTMLFGVYNCKSPSGIPKGDKDTAITILIEAEHLAETKANIERGDPKLQQAFNQLIRQAESALLEGPYSVTDKERLPPSGNKQDYASYSRYWWPDTSKPDGLPYIRIDGKTYPGSQNPSISDRPRIGAFGENSETLGLAYYLSGEEKYAEKLAELLRVWFLDPTSRMNPNLNHAQCRLGHNEGSRTGVLDGRLMISALEGSLLIANSNALTDTEREDLKAWSEEYYEWLTTNEMALEEAASNNNHASFYDVQALYFALYTGNKAAATQIAQQFTEHRLFSQIKPDGSMPEELARTRSFFYCNYNLHALFMVAHMAEKVEVDIWKANDNNSRLRAGLDYIAPYTDSQLPWPYPTLKAIDRMELFGILQMAKRAYPDGNYSELIEQLPLERRSIERNNLAFPLMR